MINTDAAIQVIEILFTCFRQSRYIFSVGMCAIPEFFLILKKTMIDNFLCNIKKLLQLLQRTD